MSFSGRYPEHDICENFNAIDVRELQRKNLLRPEPDGLVEVLNGTVELGLASVGIAPVVEGISVIRVEPDGLVEVLNGAVVLALESVACRCQRQNASRVGRRRKRAHGLGPGPGHLRFRA
jgi:hypothetical protein